MRTVAVESMKRRYTTEIYKTKIYSFGH